MRYCVDCGTALQPGAKFCTGCGSQVAQVQTADTTHESPRASLPHTADGGTASNQGVSAGQKGARPASSHDARPSAGTQWAAATPMTAHAIDWRELAPGLLRIVAAIALSMTALANWWIVEASSYSDEFGTATSSATNAHVLPLIGCIGVTLAAVVQVALLPRFLGATLTPIVRFGVRAVLCLPALVAVLIAVVTTLGGIGSDKQPAIGVTLLAMAIGFALIGLDDALDVIPAGALRWAAAVIAVLGIALTILSFVQILGDEFEEGKLKWLVAGASYLFLAIVAGLTLWLAIARPTMAHGLLIALSAGVAISALTRAWIQSNESLIFVALFRQWHGAPLVALALALAASAHVSRTRTDQLDDDAARATRMTSWVVPGFGLAACASLLTGLVAIGVRNEGSSGGTMWFLVLMFISALAYGACALLLRTHPLGRAVAVAVVALLALTILITLAAARTIAPLGEMFSEGAYLWLPILAACALTIPPSVRSVAGPLLPHQQATGGDPAPRPVEGR